MILYKYYPCNEFTFRALSELGLWCSSASNMNDPFDCLGDLEAQLDDLYKDDIIRQFRDTLKEIRSDYRHFKWSNLVALISGQRKSIIEKSTFCSLTENQFSSLMWAHYANSHRGIVLGFGFPDEATNGEGCLQKIKYIDVPPVFDPIHLLNFLKAAIIEKTNKRTNEFRIEEYEAAKNFVKSISVKTRDWEYEKEWRFWNVMTDKPQYLKYNVSQLKHVYFGYKCPEETKTLVKSILRGHGVSDDVYQDIKVKTDPKIELYV